MKFLGVLKIVTDQTIITYSDIYPPDIKENIILLIKQLDQQTQFMLINLQIIESQAERTVIALKTQKIAPERLKVESNFDFEIVD